MLSDGTIEGFVGGTLRRVDGAGSRGYDCSATAGESTLLRDHPDDDPTRPPRDADERGWWSADPCLSGGTLDIFLEAVMPGAAGARVYGDTPIARALAGGRRQRPATR